MSQHFCFWRPYALLDEEGRLRGKMKGGSLVVIWKPDLAGWIITPQPHSLPWAMPSDQFPQPWKRVLSPESQECHEDCRGWRIHSLGAHRCYSLPTCSACQALGWGRPHFSQHCTEKFIDLGCSASGGFLLSRVNPSTSREPRSHLAWQLIDSGGKKNWTHLQDKMTQCYLNFVVWGTPF